MKSDNQFQYVKSQHLEQVTALQAKRHDFSYDNHAHEEYSFGVALAPHPFPSVPPSIAA